jgi:hypothetical protein
MAVSSVIQLLDAAEGHPLQTWRFEGRTRLTIGRSEDNDVVVTDPYVSRAHAYLQFEPAGDTWRIISISRQQLMYRGEVHAELDLVDGMVFRLGPNGCYLRFNQNQEQDDNRSTLSFDPKTMPILVLDRQKLEREVGDIASGEYFAQLKKAVEARRAQAVVETKVP